MKKTAIIMMVMAMVAGLFATPMSAKASSTFLETLADAAKEEGYNSFEEALTELNGYGVESIAKGRMRAIVGGSPYPYVWTTYFMEYETGSIYTLYVYGNETDDALYPYAACVIHEHSVCENWFKYEWEELT